MTTLKEFLKPDWRKIAVFVVLFLILPFPMKFPELCNCIIEPCNCYHWTVFPLAGLTYILEFSSDLLIMIITLLAVSYLLSCLIVWIYNKSRKRK